MVAFGCTSQSRMQSKIQNPKSKINYQAPLSIKRKYRVSLDRYEYL